MVFGVIAVLLVGWGVYAFRQNYKVEAEALAAQTNANTARLELSGKTEELTKAEKDENTDSSKLALLKDATTKFACLNKDPKLTSEAEQIKRNLGLDCDAYKEPDTSPEQGAQPLPSRVYFQIQDRNQADSARDLELWLETQQYGGRRVVVPGIEYVGRRRLQQSQLRYFHDNDDERALAKQITDSLSSRCVNVRPQLTTGYEDSSAIRPRHFELWLAPDALERYGCPEPPVHSASD
jgi:hypothetical protein